MDSNYLEEQVPQKNKKRINHQISDELSIYSFSIEVQLAFKIIEVKLYDGKDLDYRLTSNIKNLSQKITGQPLTASPAARKQNLFDKSLTVSQTNNPFKARANIEETSNNLD